MLIIAFWNLKKYQKKSTNIKNVNFMLFIFINKNILIIIEFVEFIEYETFRLSKVEKSSKKYEDYLFNYLLDLIIQFTGLFLNEAFDDHKQDENVL